MQIFRSKPFLSVFLLLLTAYGLWLFTFWPGVLGNDSLAIVLEIQSRDGSFESGKPSAWYYFVKGLFQPSRRIEIPIAFQLILAAALFARMLAWIQVAGLHKTFWFSLLFICLAPHTPYFVGALYADGIYAVTATSLLFELWIISQTRTVSKTSLLVLSFALPIAVFTRPNGVIFLGSVIAVVFLLDKVNKAKLAVLTATWCCLAVIGAHTHDTRKHGFLFPLAMFETANFLQPHAFPLWQETPRVSEKTVKAIEQNRPIKLIADYFDRDYWDPLAYTPGGPDVLRLPDETKSVVVSEFLRYNLWRNIPAFVSSRVNVFLVAVFAQGGFPGLDYSEQILRSIDTRSKFRYFNMSAFEAPLRSLHKFSEDHRWLLWTPALGIILLLRAFWAGWTSRHAPSLVVTLPLMAQLAAIFAFSIAGEYRYLLPFFMAPIVLLPVLALARRQLPN